MRKLNEACRDGSHIPTLVKVLENSSGDVLELGGGIYSTAIIDMMCNKTKRKILTLENNEEWYKQIEGYQSDYHNVFHVRNWSPNYYVHSYWNVAFVDFNPTIERREAVKRLANCTDFIIVHDTSGRHEKKYQFKEVFETFKYKHTSTDIDPHTTVLSNFKNLDFLS